MHICFAVLYVRYVSIYIYIYVFIHDMCTLEDSSTCYSTVASPRSWWAFPSSSAVDRPHLAMPRRAPLGSPSRLRSSEYTTCFCGMSSALRIGQGPLVHTKSNLLEV